MLFGVGGALFLSRVLLVLTGGVCRGLRAVMKTLDEGQPARNADKQAMRVWKCLTISGVERKEDILVLIRMDSPALQLRPYLGHEHLDLFWLPIQCSCQQAQTHGLEALDMSEELIFASVFQYFVFWPGVCRTFEQVLFDVHEASLFEPSDVVCVARNGAVVFLGCFRDEPSPVGEVAAMSEATIVRGEAAVEFLQLEVTAGFGMSAVGEHRGSI